MSRTTTHVLPFAKMEGLGNDYIYMWESDLPSAYTEEMLPGLALRVSDRHFGAGSDGLVLIGASDKADFRMRIFNSDGSEARMCGNAIRCVGKYLYDRALTTRTGMSIETLSGIRTLRVELEEGAAGSVRVDMGPPLLVPANIPMAIDGKDFINREITVDGRVYLATAVSMGNPHLVVPVSGLSMLDLWQLGPLFENHHFFPDRVNTEFVEVVDRSHIRMRVWERGAGETLACGTGACAAVVACALNKWADRSAIVHLPGGDLHIDWAENGVVYKTGPARHILDGEYWDMF